MTPTHQAAVIPQKGGPLKVVERATPEPGPGEILVAVKAIALNPADRSMRDVGMPPVPFYPAVAGCDVAGEVAKIGPDVPDAPAVGSRVIALATSFYKNGSADYGAFQEFALAEWQGVVALPQSLSFEEGAVFPLAVATALSGWTSIGVPLTQKHSPADKQAVLIWGGASSVGTIAIQSAKSMGFTVYTTASAKNHAYLKTLGADATFDYKDSNATSEIIAAAKKDGVTLKTAFLTAAGTMDPILEVLKVTKGNEIAKLAHAPLIPADAPSAEGIEVVFINRPSDDAERQQFTFDAFHTWLESGLASGTVVSSPPIKIETGGLEALNKGLDMFKEGVSATKIVVPL